MEIHEEKEQSLYPMLPTAGDYSQGIPAHHQPITCAAMVGLLDENSKRVATEWSATINQLESKKLEAEKIPLSSAGILNLGIIVKSVFVNVYITL
jgi:hypothetical protein